jgi:acyltransferase-like protein
MIAGTRISSLQAIPSAPVPARLLFVDNLRWLMIVLVVTVHASVTYSHIGSWYYYEPTNPGPLSLLAFVLYETHLQAFFMGLLFLIAGYFVPGSFDRKGARRFMADRGVRLGIPTALYALVIQPIINDFILKLPGVAPLPLILRSYWKYVASLRFLSGTGPLWFALALLIFSGIYALGRLATGSVVRSQAESKLPGHAAVVLLIAAISVSTFIMRLVQPIGTDILNMQLCFFSQYIILFGVGIVAHRRNWLLRIPHDFGVFWFRLALVAGPPLWLAMILGGGARSGDWSRYTGGFHWQSAVGCFWESFFCVGVCLGLLVVFRDRFNRQGHLARFLSENAFTVYVFHPPILIALSLVLHGLALASPWKFLLLSGASLLVCFLTSHYVIRRIPGLRRIL